MIFSVNARVLAKTTVVRFRADRRRQPAQEATIGQARDAGPRRACRSDSTSTTVGGEPAGGGGLDDPAGPRRPDQEPRDRLGRAAGRRQPDPARVAIGPRRQPLERDRQVGPALRRHQRVDLVDDQVPDATPVLVPGRLAQQERQALGRGDQQVRRLVARASDAPSAEVSPVRTPTVTGLASEPEARRIASRGSARFRSMS